MTLALIVASALALPQFYGRRPYHGRHHGGAAGFGQGAAYVQPGYGGYPQPGYYQGIYYIIIIIILYEY